MTTSVKLRIRQRGNGKGSVNSSAQIDKLINMLESHSGKRSIARLRKTTKGLLITVNNTEEITKLNGYIKQGNNTLDLDQGTKIEASLSLVVRGLVSKKVMTSLGNADITRSKRPKILS